jgi:molybdopterin-guanine dinucleotide biosynthesis protein B
LVEGFKSSDLLKIEVWRAPTADYAPLPVRYPDDAFIVAIATDAAQSLPEPTLLPVLDLNDPDSVAEYLVQNEHRFDYNADNYQF